MWWMFVCHPSCCFEAVKYLEINNNNKKAAVAGGGFPVVFRHVWAATFQTQGALT
jgi:hypothetical protein